MNLTLVVESCERSSLAGLQRGGSDGEARGHGEAGGGETQGDVPLGEELIGQQLGDGGPLGRVGMQHPLDQRRRHRVDLLQNKNVGEKMKKLP